MRRNYHDNFNIVFRELWEYETGYYFYLLNRKNDKKVDRQKRFLITLSNRIKALIVDLKEPYVTKTSDPEKYNALLEQKKIITTFEDQLQQDWFYDDVNIYSFNQEIPISIETKGFHYWLAVKVRQYENNIFALKDFLEYHFQQSFHNNLREMAEYLETLLIQYDFIRTKAAIETEMFIERLDAQLIEFQKQREFAMNTEAIVSSDKSKTNNRIQKSFVLIASQEDSQYFEKRRVRFLSIYNKLRNTDDLMGKQFIDSRTTFEQFKAIFSGVPILPNDRIRWTGNFLELKTFVNYLRDTNRIINTKENIWNRTVYCFVDRDGKEIYRKQLSDANGSPRTIEKMSLVLYDFPK